MSSILLLKIAQGNKAYFLGKSCEEELEINEDEYRRSTQSQQQNSIRHSKKLIYCERRK